MADIAIEFDLSHLPREETKPRRRRGENKGRYVSRKVRQRNRRGTNERWHPTRALKKFRPPRAAQIAAAIMDSLFDTEPDVEEPVVGYSDCAVEYVAGREQEDVVEIDERHRVILTGIEAEMRARAFKAPEMSVVDGLSQRIDGLRAGLEELISLRPKTGIDIELEKDILQVRSSIQELEIERGLAQCDAETYTAYRSAA